jgi:hypothetical protein
MCRFKKRLSWRQAQFGFESVSPSLSSARANAVPLLVAQLEHDRAAPLIFNFCNWRVPVGAAMCASCPHAYHMTLCRRHFVVTFCVRQAGSTGNASMSVRTSTVARPHSS